MILLSIGGYLSQLKKCSRKKCSRFEKGEAFELNKYVYKKYAKMASKILLRRFLLYENFFYEASKIALPKTGARLFAFQKNHTELARILMTNMKNRRICPLPQTFVSVRRNDLFFFLTRLACSPTSAESPLLRRECYIYIFFLRGDRRRVIEIPNEARRIHAGGDFSRAPITRPRRWLADGKFARNQAIMTNMALPLPM